MHIKLWLENLEGRDFEDSDVDVRIILKWVLKEWDAMCGLASTGSGEGLMMGSCEHINVPSDCIKGGDILDQVNGYQLLKEDCSMNLIRWFLCL
jgi:hypothetical protein